MKKELTIGIIVVCLAAAAAVTVMTRKRATGVNSIRAGDTVWVKCTNKECGAEYQMGKRDYYARIQEKRKLNPMSMMDVPLACEQCGEESVHLAKKCEKCEHVFLASEAATEDYTDRCLDCGYSATEARRQNR